MDAALQPPEPQAWTVVVGYEDNLEALTWQVPLSVEPTPVPAVTFDEPLTCALP